MNGVVNMARAVLMAVRLTDSSMLALESEEIKLEMFPPGQEATRIIPIAIVQVMLSPKARASRKVNRGSSTIWHTKPRITDLGLVKTLMNIFGLMPRATPNITNASTMLMVFIPPAFSVTLMASIAAAVSGLIRVHWNKSFKDRHFFVSLLIKECFEISLYLIQ